MLVCHLPRYMLAAVTAGDKERRMNSERRMYSERRMNSVQAEGMPEDSPRSVSMVLGWRTVVGTVPPDHLGRKMQGVTVSMVNPGLYNLHICQHQQPLAEPAC